MSDDAQMDYVKQSNRVLITRDADFLRMVAKNAKHPGIVFTGKQSTAVGKIVLACVALQRTTTASAMKGQVRFV